MDDVRKYIDNDIPEYVEKDLLKWVYNMIAEMVVDYNEELGSAVEQALLAIEREDVKALMVALLTKQQTDKVIDMLVDVITERNDLGEKIEAYRAWRKELSDLLEELEEEEDE
jgi:hypothetical protein